MRSIAAPSMTDTTGDRPSHQRGVTHDARLNLLILLPAFAVLLLSALWAAVFYLVPEERAFLPGKALAQSFGTQVYLWWGMAASTGIIGFVALLMWQIQRQCASELAARNAQAINAAAVEGSLDSFYVLKTLRGADGNIHDFLITEINARGTLLLAKPKSQIIGRKLCELLPVIRTSGFFDRYVNVVNTGEALEEEREIVTPDIKARWIQQQIIAIDSGVAVTTRDITARRETEQALRDSEARLRTITDAIPALIAYVDANQRYRFNNIAYDGLFGMSRDEMRDKPVRELLGESFYARVAPYIQRTLQGEKVNFELEDQDEDVYRCVELTYIPQFSDDGQQVLGFHVMNQNITAKKLEERRLLHLAQVDSLTGLANRAGFLQRLSDAMAQSKASHALIALMYLDIDHFKTINDTYGHPIGDALLKAFVGRLARALRASDTVARLGGDEFTVIMENLSRPEDAATVAAKIVQAIQAPFAIDDDLSVSVSVSIGLAFYQDGATDRKALIRQADEMLYLAKEAGRNTYRVAPFPSV